MKRIQFKISEALNLMPYKSNMLYGDVHSTPLIAQGLVMFCFFMDKD